MFPCDFSVRRKKSFGDRRGSFCVRAGLERALRSRQEKSRTNVTSPTQAQTSPIVPWKRREPAKEDRRNGSGTIASCKVEPEPHRRAQSSAQSVKATKAGREYPAEEAPRKTANTEPTEGQTDAAAETEAQDPTVEPPEPEGEALSLDSIDDLVLPGDVDPGEEQQSQRWRITDDALAPLSMDPLQSSASQIRVRTPSDAPLLRARMAARTRHSLKVEETDSRGSKAPETARRAPRGSAKKKTRAQLFLPENAKIKKYEKISQKLLTKPPARCIMCVQSTPKVHTRR